jgi:hypothetical protein
MEIITNHIKLQIPYLVVDEKDSRLKTTLISLEYHLRSRTTDLISTGTEDLCQKSPVYLDWNAHYIWYHGILEAPYTVDVLERYLRF